MADQNVDPVAPEDSFDSDQFVRVAVAVASGTQAKVGDDGKRARFAPEVRGIEEAGSAVQDVDSLLTFENIVARSAK